MADEKRIFDRRPGESAKAWEAYCIYRDMGTKRSLMKLGQHLGKVKANFEPWSKKYGWRERIAAWTADQDRKAEQMRDELMRETLKQHVELAVAMRKAALQGLKLVEEWQVGGIASLAKNAVSIERLALGLPDKVEVTGKDGGAIEHVVDIGQVAADRIAAICGDVLGEKTDDEGKDE